MHALRFMRRRRDRRQWRDVAVCSGAPSARARSSAYAVAYGRFAALADEGDAPSALIALAMVRHGPGLFGSDWSLTRGQAQRWRTLALRDIDENAALIAEHDRGE